ncbi:hypothetical protein BDW62DRAFT_202762 [Aspergillus aurantiobrunneus]
MSSFSTMSPGETDGTPVSESFDQVIPVRVSSDTHEARRTHRSRKQTSLLFKSYLKILSYGARSSGVLAIILGRICAMGSGVALPLMNIVFGRLVGNFTEYFIPGTGLTKEEFLSAFRTFILYLFALKFVLTYIFMMCFRFVSLQASSTLRLEHMHALFAQPVSKLDEMSPGTVINATVSSSNIIQQSISDRLATVLQTFTLLITAYAIAFHYSWSLTLVVSSAILFIAICMSITTPILVRLLHGMHEAEDKHMSIATEVFSSIRTVFSLNAEDALTERYVHWVKEASKRGQKISSLGAVNLGFVFFGVCCSFSLTFWYGLRQFYFGRIDDVNTIITVFLSVLISVMVMGQIVAPLMVISKAIGSAETFFDVIDSGECQRAGLRDPQVSSEEDIVFEDVTFVYPSRPMVAVLRNFSATFQRGKTTALVGPSGSGKSTAMALIESWYQVSQHGTGGIFVGGQNIDQVDAKWWRTQVALVQQESFLFNDTIYNNICLGLIGNPLGEQGQPCEVEHGRYSGYDTMVGEGGLALSGGQRQRLAVARSIVSKPSVLILDEATSSMDAHSECIVQAALDRVAKNCTTIVTAHRLSTVRKVDHIIVMEDGTNIEQGSHLVLTGRGGLYRQLVEAQRIDTEASAVNKFDNDVGDYEEQLEIPLNENQGAAVGFSLQSWLFAKLIDTFRFDGRDILETADFWALIFCTGSDHGDMLFHARIFFQLHIDGTIARRDYFTRILRNPVPYFDRGENASGPVASRLSSDTKQLQDFCGIPSAFPIIAVLSVTGCLIIAFIYGWKLSAVGVISVLPVLTTAAFLRVRYELRLEALNAEVYAHSSSFISEAVRAFWTVSALTMEEFIVNRYTKLLEDQQRNATRKSWYSSLIFAFSERMEFLAMALSFWYGGQLLASREYDPVKLLRCAYCDHPSRSIRRGVFQLRSKYRAHKGSG